mgnify:CR=1 FL=1
MHRPFLAFFLSLVFFCSPLSAQEPPKVLEFSPRGTVKNLRQAKALFSAFPVNTDDRPAIEFSSPQSYQNRMAGMEKALVEEQLLHLLEDLLKEAPLDKDPYLMAFGPEAKAYAAAGLDLIAMSALRNSDRLRAKERLLSALNQLPPEFGESVKSTAQNW